MAEAIIFPVVARLLSQLASPAYKEIALIYGAKKEFAKLKDTFSALQAVLLDAEQKADLNHAVKDWLEKLKDAAYDADDILDDLSYATLRREVISRDKKAKKVRIFFSENNQLAFAVKMVHKIKNLRQRLELIDDDRNKFHFSETIPDQSRTMDRETYSFVRQEEVIGRDEEKEELVKRLLQTNEKQNVSVDAIVGVGGLGKTTLAQSVFNHKRVEDAFELRLWVCISEIFDLKIIVEKIIERATDQRPSGLDLESLQIKLRKEIDGKKYLLVMDDLWNEDGERWAALTRLLMGGAKGSKILITTRSELVAEVSEATSPYILKGLSESNSWILFKQMDFKEREEPDSPNMIVIGKEIATKCMGVPLVIRTIGRLLYLKKSEAQWLSFKNNELSTIAQQEHRITQVLKLSYNHLPSHLKPCFAYCSLFPKDYWFNKDEMIQLWVAEGFVQSQGENECLEDVGNEYFMQLIWRSIFQDVKRNNYGDVIGCKMHDLMHDLARLIAGIEYFTSDSDIKNVNEQTRRVSFDCGGKLNCSALSTSHPKLYKLRTFLSPRLDKTETRLETHISSLDSLRVLDLKWLKLPFSIGMLRHLRFLNLSGNKEIKSLPSSITNLHNLQTLNISDCSSLKELPRDIGNLINLRHFNLSDSCIEFLPNSIVKLQKLQLLNLSLTWIRELPRDISNLVNLKHLDLRSCYKLSGMPLGLNKLTGLQTMNLYAVGPSISSKDSGLWQLNTLVNIKGDLCIRDLHHLRKDSSQANTVNLKDNHGVRHLELVWSKVDYNPKGIDHDFVVLEKLHPNKNIERLSIDRYGGVRLSRWVSSLSNLTEIWIRSCERLQYVPRFDRLQNLQRLQLWNLKLIEYMDDNMEEFDSSVFFPSLQELILWRMYKLKGWWKPREFTPKDPGESFILPSFHCLSSLDISSCPQLFSIPSPNSSLKTLRLVGCDNLHSECFQQFTGLHSLCISDLVMLPDLIGNLPSLEKLEIVDCTKLTLHPEGIRQLSSLKNLIIWNCEDLVMLPDWIGNLTSLEGLEIVNCPKLTLLPEGIRQLSSLRKLVIWTCKDLVMLPNWIGNLPSLEILRILYCPKLTLLPEGIRQLSSLRLLVIHGCESLEERCSPEIGEDWSKIAHVKETEIG